MYSDIPPTRSDTRRAEGLLDAANGMIWARDSLHTVHASLTTDVLRRSGPGSAGRNAVQRWIGAGGAATSRCVRVLDDIARGSRSDLATLTVALREVGALVQARPAGCASPPAAITPVRPA